MRASWSNGVLGALTALCLTACVEDRCVELSARLELTVQFTGFDLTLARRLEIESTVYARGPEGSSHPYMDKRVGNRVFPEEARSGRITFVLDPGSYVRALGQSASADEEITHVLIMRVYGGSLGEPERLLAEGYRSVRLKVRGCYLNQSMKVSATPTCERKSDGEPCVGTHAGPAVCRCAQPTGDCDLVCQPSICGDGYTDRWQGELCESAQLPGQCSADCIPLPRTLDAEPTAEGSALVGAPLLIGLQPGDTLTHGFFELRYDAGQAPLPAGSLLVADLNGDGCDELTIGLPEGRSVQPSQVVRGKVVVKGYPVVGSPSFGNPANDHITVHGSSSESWLGTSLAAGDVDGDGVSDLIVGAPMRGGGAGAVYLFHGGSGRAIPLIASSGYTLTVDSPGSLGQYQAILGLQGESAEHPGDRLGHAVAVADFDGDGVMDLAVAAPGHSRAGQAFLGAVYLIPGGAELGLQSIGDLMGLPHVVLEANRPWTRLGIALATGDLDGDGIPDLIMGSDASRSTAVCGADHCGGVFVLFGGSHVFAHLGATVDVHGADLEGDPHHWRLTADEWGSPAMDLGGSVAVADLDRDGLGELAVTRGRRGSQVSPSQVLLLPGTAFAELRVSGTPISLTERALWLGGEVASSFGAVLGGFDTDGDGTDDLVIGAPTHTGAHQGQLKPQAGAVYILLGSPRVDVFALQTVDLMLAAETAADVGLPLIGIGGIHQDGFLGSAVVASSQIGSTNPMELVRRLLVLEPGWRSDEASDLDQARGRIIGFHLPGLLPCGHSDSCEIQTP